MAIAVVTSIGEPTTDLCIWSLERQGFEVKLYSDGTTLADKLKRIYNDMDEDFVRVDADVVCNRNLSRSFRELWKIKGEHVWWLQGRTFGWHAQDLVYGGVQMIDHKALPALRENVDRFIRHIRPETQLSRIPEFHNPRKFESLDGVFGIHGYKQATHIPRIKKLKLDRNQYENYDWELAERLEQL
jgi:hypothetical protein